MKRRVSILVIAEIGVAVALAFVLDFFKVWRAPQGGSLTLTIIPILIIAYRRGLVPGLMAGALVGTLKLSTGYLVHPLQAILDYPLAFCLVGLSGFMGDLYHRAKRYPYVYLGIGILLAFLGRLTSHVLAGIIFFAEYAPEGTPALLYSLIYNLTFMVPEAIVAFFIMLLLSHYRLILRGWDQIGGGRS